jgi:hypothetical protein
VEVGGVEPPSEEHSISGTTCLARCSISHDGNTTCEAHRHTHPLCFSHRLTGRHRRRSCDMTLHPRAQAQVGSGLGLKRPERRRRRWRLSFAAGLTRKAAPSACAVSTSRPPSKPGHPRFVGNVNLPTCEVWGARAPASSRVARFAPAGHASRLRCRSVRCFSRCQSRSFSLSRLSCACLPLASAISSLTLLRFQYIAVGIRV